MAEHEKKDPSDIKIEDRRRFAPDGSVRSPSSDPPSSSPTSDAAASQASSSSATSDTAASPASSSSNTSDAAASPASSSSTTSEPSGSPKAPPPSSPKNNPLPKIDFSTLIFSFYHAALLHLGEMEEEEGQPPSSVNLPMAKQSIDLLDILKAKTKGNLTKEEEALLDGFLFELRMKFLQRSKKS